MLTTMVLAFIAMGQQISEHPDSSDTLSRYMLPRPPFEGPELQLTIQSILDDLPRCSLWAWFYISEASRRLAVGP